VTSDPAALLRGAVQAHETGRPDEAERDYRRLLAITPDDPGALAHLAVLLMEAERWEEGAELLDRSLAIDPHQPHMLANRGTALVALGRFEEAAASFEQAIALQPDSARAAAYHDLGVYLQGLERLAQAADAYGKAIALQPALAPAWRERGLCLARLGRLDEALTSLDRALALVPEDAETVAARGIALYLSGRLDSALAVFDRALALAPDGAAIHNNRGLVLQALGRFDEALAGFEQALASRPQFAEAHWNKAFILILLGDYAAGWRLFEWRWRRGGSPPAREFPVPLWLGAESLAGKTLLLHAEQGLGDTLQMLRYAPVLAARGARVLLQVQPPLVELASRVQGVAAVVGPGDVFALDVHCPLMSLPLALGTRIDTVPAAVPYLSAPEAKIAQWRARLGPRTRRRIGLAWAGSATHENDRNRSIALRALLPLLDADADIFSLQREYRPADEAVLRADGRIRSHAEALEDFSDTAALIEPMDLVISVDTSAAHLAGALGKPVFVLLPWVPDYRWGLERDDSPWYPAARLFRQPRAGDWDSVIAEVAAAL
jgi:tetratricopeptide (TPR) repeat protein